MDSKFLTKIYLIFNLIKNAYQYFIPQDRNNQGYNKDSSQNITNQGQKRRNGDQRKSINYENDSRDQAAYRSGGKQGNNNRSKGEKGQNYGGKNSTGSRHGSLNQSQLSSEGLAGSNSNNNSYMAPHRDNGKSGRGYTHMERISEQEHYGEIFYHNEIIDKTGEERPNFSKKTRENSSSTTATNKLIESSQSASDQRIGSNNESTTENLSNDERDVTENDDLEENSPAVWKIENQDVVKPSIEDPQNVALLVDCVIETRSGTHQLQIHNVKI